MYFKSYFTSGYVCDVYTMAEGYKAIIWRGDCENKLETVYFDTLREIWDFFTLNY